MRISREIEVDIDVELDDVLEYIEGCCSKKELQEIKEAVLEGLEEVDDDSVDGYIRNTQNFQTAKEAFFNAVNRGIDLNSLTNILDNLA
jgi:predicted Ser/Thr protein kinase